MAKNRQPEELMNEKSVSIMNANSNVKSSISKKYTDCVIKHSTKDTDKPITNTRIGEKGSNVYYGGSYHFGDEEYPEFLKLYSNEIIAKSNEEYLTEVQLDKNGGILIDIDLHFNYDVTDRIYDESHIEDGIDIYLGELKSIYQFDESTRFEIYVMQKDGVNRVKEKNITKDGIHIIIGIQCDHETQKILRKRVMPKIAEAWADFPIINSDSWEGVFDMGISSGKTNWQLFGSRKPRHDVYKLTNVYEITCDPDDGELRRESIEVCKFDVIKNIYKLSARYPNHPSFFYTSDFIKIRGQVNGGSYAPTRKEGALRQNRMTYEDKNTFILNIKTHDDLADALNDFLDNVNSTEYELREAHDYTMTLPESYYGQGSFSKWIRVGWALRNIDDRLLIVWIALSAKSANFSFNTDIADLYARWQTFDLKNPDGLTKRSIMHWSKEDAYEKFKSVRETSIDFYIDQTIKSITLDKIGNDKNSRGCGDFDIAGVLYQLHKDEYVCVSVKSGVWYKLKKHCWIQNDSGTALRHSISTALRNLYWKRAQTMMSMASSLNPPDEEKSKRMQEHANKILNICTRLGNTNDKNNIMREAREWFYDNDFLQQIDNNPYLLSCNNGVVDFKQKTFRKGYPEDHLSKCTKIDYNPLDPAKHSETINEIKDFMRKLFPEQQLHDYMWEHLASTLLGTSSNQTFKMYLGIGAHGKSVLTDLMKEVLGDYKGDVPLSLITDRRGKIGGLAPEIVALKGVRYALMQEPQEGDQINEGVLKQLTSGFDPITARAPFMTEMVTFIPQFKLVVCTNVLMDIKSQDHGTWRRIRVVDFESLFTNDPYKEHPKDKKPYQFLKDTKINEKFPAWREVFLAMLVEIAFKTDGIVKDCPRVLGASNSYKEKNDYIAEFIRDRIVDKANGRVTKSEITNEFTIWYKSIHGNNGCPSSKKVHTYMDKKYCNYDVHRAWIGIGINYDNNPVDVNDSNDDNDDSHDDIDTNDL
jgi:P4 family phage/plasmid primase-like protien